EIVLERQLGLDVPAKLHLVIAWVVTGQIPGQAESVPHAIARVDQRERQSRAGQDRMVVEIIDMFVPHAVRVVITKQARRSVVHSRVVHPVVDDHEVKMLVGQRSMLEHTISAVMSRVGEVEYTYRPAQTRLLSCSQMFANGTIICADR